MTYFPVFMEPGPIFTLSEILVSIEAQIFT